MKDLLEDEAHWNTTLQEAVVSRSLFGIMIVTCGLGNPRQLWETHKQSLAEDVLLQVLRHQNHGQNVDFNEAIYNQALILLEDKVIGLGGKELKDYGLPAPQRHQHLRLSREMLRETNYELEEEYVASHEPLLVQDQAVAYQVV